MPPWLFFIQNKEGEFIKKLFKVILTTIILISILTGLGLISESLKDMKDTKTKSHVATKEAQSLLEDSLTGNKPIDKKDFQVDFGHAAGMLVIPKIDADLPIVEGTHEDDLQKGVGHYDGTSYPLEDDQIFLSGHRDTIFKRLGELEVGDIMTMQMPYGEFDYEIINTKIVDADDRTIIVPHDEETLTVSTCYPFGYIGSAPNRYIIDAKPVN